MTDPLILQTLATLSRGHGLFAGRLVDERSRHEPQLQALADSVSQTGGDRLPDRAAARSHAVVQAVRRSIDPDRELAQIMSIAQADHAPARRATRAILQAAHADSALAADTPLGRREAMVRMAARLRAQRRHIVRSRARARQLVLRLRRLRYLQAAARRQHHHVSPTAGPLCWRRSVKPRYQGYSRPCRTSALDTRDGFGGPPRVGLQRQRGERLGR